MDAKAKGKVWDMYSDIPGGTPAYVYQFFINQCSGSYNSEGDCYNREHSFPKSWFNDQAPMYTDLFHIYPTDGWVNNKRENYPFSVTGSPTWTSTNGSKLGASSYSGYTGVVFEPVNGYKGDFARTYFYMAVRYYNEDAGWPGSDMVTGSQPKEWARRMLMEWHNSDPVSQKEINRNEAVYALQGNRNPFIDNPLYAEKIWGSQTGHENIRNISHRLIVYPNPAGREITVSTGDTGTGYGTITIYNITGTVINRSQFSGSSVTVSTDRYPEGLYIITVETGGRILKGRFVISRE